MIRCYDKKKKGDNKSIFIDVCLYSFRAARILLHLARAFHKFVQELCNNLVPRGHDPFGQHHVHSGDEFAFLCFANQSDVRKNRDWPEVAILGADRKDRDLRIRDWLCKGYGV